MRKLVREFCHGKARQTAGNGDAKEIFLDQLLQVDFTTLQMFVLALDLDHCCRLYGFSLENQADLRGDWDYDDFITVCLLHGFVCSPASK